jgi:hypothetical protein
VAPVSGCTGGEGTFGGGDREKCFPEEAELMDLIRFAEEAELMDLIRLPKPENESEESGSVFGGGAAGKDVSKKEKSASAQASTASCSAAGG